MTTKTKRTRTTTPPPPQAIAHGITLQEGDFLTLAGPHRSSAYTEAKVYAISEQGIHVTYGSRNLSDSLRIGRYTDFRPVQPDEVDQIWRRHYRTTHEQVPLDDGRILDVTTSDYHWVQLHPPQEEQPTEATATIS